MSIKDKFENFSFISFCIILFVLIIIGNSIYWIGKFLNLPVEIVIPYFGWIILLFFWTYLLGTTHKNRFLNNEENNNDVNQATSPVTIPVKVGSTLHTKRDVAAATATI